MTYLDEDKLNRALVLINKDTIQKFNDDEKITIFLQQSINNWLTKHFA